MSRETDTETALRHLMIRALRVVPCTTGELEQVAEAHGLDRAGLIPGLLGALERAGHCRCVPDPHGPGVLWAAVPATPTGRAR